MRSLVYCLGIGTFARRGCVVAVIRGGGIRSVVVTCFQIGKLLVVDCNLAALIAFDAVEIFRDLRFQLCNLERLAAGLGERLRIDEELVAQHGLELAGIHFRHQHMVEALEQFAEVFRQATAATSPFGFFTIVLPIVTITHGK